MRTSRVFSAATLCAAIVGLLAKPSSASCVVTTEDDICTVDSTTPTNVIVDALSGTDTLQLGGTIDFFFNAGSIGPGLTYRNFETFRKVDSSNATLTGEVVNGVNWFVDAGTLMAAGTTGDAISNSAFVIVAPGATFALGSSETIGTLSAQGDVDLSNFYLTASGGGNFDGTISGTGGIIKAAGGTMRLAGTNTYTGGTAVLGGLLLLRGGSAIADNSVINVIGLGTLELENDETIGGLLGDGLVFLNNNTLTVGGGDMSSSYGNSIIGSGGLTKIGTGEFVLTGHNNYTGPTNVNGGTLTIIPNPAFSNPSNTTLLSDVTVAAGATVNFLTQSGFGATTIDSLAGAGNVVVGFNRTLITNGDGSSTTFSGSISGQGQFRKAGTGNLTLSGTNSTFTGFMTIFEGSLTVANGDAIPDDGLVSMFTGSTLILANDETVGTLNAAGTVSLGHNTLTVGAGTSFGNITGTGGLTKNGTGLFSFFAASTYSGPTTVNGGTVELRTGAALNDASSVIVNAGGSLLVTNAETIGSLSGAGNIVLNTRLTTGSAGSSTFSGTSSGAQGLTKVGASTFTITGAQGYTGLTSVDAGQLTVNGSLAGAVTIQSGATFSGDATVAGTLTNLGTVAVGASVGTQNFGDYVGGGAFNMDILANLGGAPVNGVTHDFVNIASNVTGVTTINLFPTGIPTTTTADGFELVRVGGAVASNAFQLAGGSLIYNGFRYKLFHVADFLDNFDGFFLRTVPLCDVDNNDNICLIDSTTSHAQPLDALLGTDTLQLTGTIDFAFNVGLIGTTYTNFETFEKTGVSNVTLTGSAGSAANWSIVAGTLTASGGNAIFDTASVDVGSGATFALAGAETIGSLSGAGNVTLGTSTLTTGGNNSSTTLSGVLSGTGGLTKVGSGTFSLIGNQTYTGLTSVNAGALSLGGSLPGNVSIAGGAYFRGNATVAGTVSNAGTVAPGTGIGAMTFGSYAASGGAALDMEVQFDALTPLNGVTHDHLAITGNVSGNTAINVIPVGVNSERRDFELVRVGGNTTKTSFQLSAPVFSGGREFRLKYVKNAFGTNDAYFLKGEPHANLVLNAAVLQAGQSLAGNCFRQEDSAAPSHQLGFSAGSVTADTGTVTNSSQLFDCSTTGASLVATEDMRFGVAAMRASAVGSVALPDGLQDYEGELFGAQAYGTFTFDGYALNLTAGYATGDWAIDAVPAKIAGAFASAEVARKIDLGPAELRIAAGGWFDSMSCGASCLFQGTKEDASSLTAKASARLNAALFDGALSPYVEASVADEILGGNGVYLSDASVSLSRTDAVVELGLGADIALGGDVRGFVDIRGEEALAESERIVTAKSGLRITW